MDDLQYEYVWFEVTAFKEPADTLDCLKAAAAGFRENITSIHAMLNFPLPLIMMASKYEMALNDAIIDDTGDPFFDRAKLEAPSEQRERIHAIRDKRLTEYERQEISNPDLMHANGEAAAEVLMFMLERYKMKATPEMRAYLCFAVVGLWSAVEVFLKDLWIAAMNHESILRQWVANPEPKDDDEEQADGKSITVAKLIEHGLDIRGKTGVVLAERGGNGSKFDSLKEAEKSYQRAFRTKKAFAGPAGDRQPYFDMVVLQAARNAILHAGRIDSNYVRKVKIVPPQKSSFPHVLALTQGQFPITGLFVSTAANSAMDFCSNVLKFVSEEITEIESRGDGSSNLNPGSGA